MEQAMSLLNRAANSNAVVNTCLAGVFAVLSARSWAQEQTIKALEAEKDSLLKTNKGMKNAMWNWKQALYAEAEVDPKKALVPLSTLKSIYGEVVTPSSGNSTIHLVNAALLCCELCIRSCTFATSTMMSSMFLVNVDVLYVSARA